MRRLKSSIKMQERGHLNPRRHPPTSLREQSESGCLTEAALLLWSYCGVNTACRQVGPLSATPGALRS